MKRTSGASLVTAVGVGVLVGFILDATLTALALPTLTPSLMLPIMLLLLGAGVLAWAWSIRKDVRAGKRPDPFRAVRAVALAKASAVLGALMAGFAGGLASFVFTRPVAPSGESLAILIATAVSAIGLMIAALLAESFCVLPPDDPADLEASNVEPA